MPRTSQEQSQERQAFLLELFRSQPDISSKDALNTYKDKFGATLNLKTFNQLREQAEDERASASASTPERAEAPEPVSVEETASNLRSAASPEPTNGLAPAKKLKAKGVGPKNVFVDAPREHLSFLESIVQQLQDAGATNVRIDHSTERWMVLVVDSK